MNESSTSVQSIDTEELRVDVPEVSPLTIRFAGSADTRSLGAIENVLARFHERALEAAVTEVVVDFRGLFFINSSCFKAFVVWLGHVQDLEQSKQYRIRFLQDDDKPWQKRSLGALSCFAVDLVLIESSSAA
ncbi:hypothetical protein AKJ09_05973 [Labilithrix luteola]|uniref:STAS domain-containing protein n=1 Tax=Labilithrix luteola TaxID=1391654 RepID=A0A0K1Q1P6_9BACT|nr:hypothetical protein [Labilithrix luteola]AKU99309.1 hypothetical protein AKJ09_05973 [Labilithrix luteola]